MRDKSTAIAAMDWSHRLRDADSGEWMDAVGQLQRLGYTSVWGDEDDEERLLSLHHPWLPRIDVLMMEGEPWRVSVERTSAHRGCFQCSHPVEDHLPEEQGCTHPECSCAQVPEQ